MNECKPLKGGISAFFLACQGPSVEVAKVFLEAGADVNCRMVGWCRLTQSNPH